jgi:hypothetical protein
MNTCPTCGCSPCINVSFCKVCRNADRQGVRSKPGHAEDLARQRRLVSDDISLDAAWYQLNGNRPTPKATIEAVMHAVRQRGLVALKEPATAARLEHCDAAAKAEIEQRIAILQRGRIHA